MELLMTDANNTALYYANLKTATVDKIQYFRQNANLLSRGRVALLWQYLKTIDELWQQTNDVIQVMSKSEPCLPTPWTVTAALIVTCQMIIMTEIIYITHLLFIQLYLHYSRAAQQNDCAFCDKSIKFGTHKDNDVGNNSGYWAIANASSGGRG